MEAIDDDVCRASPVLSGRVPGEGDGGDGGTSDDHKVVRSRGGSWKEEEGERPRE